MKKERVCKICGEKLIGRSDKIYCSYNCRIYANNLKSREIKEKSNSYKYKNHIDKALKILIKENAIKSLKIILITAYICKIFSTFAGHTKNTE
ncbi:MAG: hypothetical protein Q4B21_03490 [Bacteroidia bacterium]|nr:hypothetical protein [Bacteroidia bacterium]